MEIAFYGDFRLLCFAIISNICSTITQHIKDSALYCKSVLGGYILAWIYQQYQYKLLLYIILNLLQLFLLRITHMFI